MHKAVRNVTRLLERIQDYEKRIVKRRGALGRDDYEALLEALALLARSLSPFAPHIAEELLIALGRDASVGFPAARRGAPPAQWPGIIDRYARICYTPPLMIRRQHGKRRRRFAKAGGLPSRAGGVEGR